MTHYFEFGQSREMSVLHWLMDNRPWQRSSHPQTLKLLVNAARRQCLIEASWENIVAVELCQTLCGSSAFCRVRTDPPLPAQTLIEHCQAGNLEVFEQVLLRLQQQVTLSSVTAPDTS